MRVCFDGLCFASRRPAAVEQETQTVLCGATALDTQHLVRLLKYANFAAPTNGLGLAFGTPPVLAPQSQSQTQTQSFSSQTQTQSQPSSGASLLSPASSALSSSSVASHGSAGKDLVVPSLKLVASTIVAGTMNENSGDLGDASIIQQTQQLQTANQQLQNDTFNNNFDVTAAAAAAAAAAVNNVKQIGMLQGDLQQNLYINDPTSLNLTPREQELLKVIQARDIRIRELEDCLRHKHDEVAELRSHLDKFQSVFRSSGGAGGVSPGGRKMGAHGGVQRQRAQGISAEPQRDISVLELMHVTFPKYDKEDR